MSELYNHKVVEKKWQKVWDDEQGVCGDPTIIPASRSIMRWWSSRIRPDRGCTLDIRARTRRWISLRK